jgi:hypothetical protein
LSGALNVLAKLVCHKACPRREDAMVEKVIMPGRNVVDFAKYRQGRKFGAARMAARTCRHCGAAIGEGESEDECSSAGVGIEAPRLRESLRKFYAE